MRVGYLYCHGRATRVGDFRGDPALFLAGKGKITTWTIINVVFSSDWITEGCLLTQSDKCFDSESETRGAGQTLLCFPAFSEFRHRVNPFLCAPKACGYPWLQWFLVSGSNLKCTRSSVGAETSRWEWFNMLQWCWGRSPLSSYLTCLALLYWRDSRETYGDINYCDLKCLCSGWCPPRPGPG